MKFDRRTVRRVVEGAMQFENSKREVESIVAAIMRLHSKTKPSLLPNIAGQFEDFDDWVNAASNRIGARRCPVDGTGRPQDAVCVDSKGRRCTVGADFHRARDEKTFPIYYFWHCERGTRCGKSFRSASAEAFHRHNFPRLCRPRRSAAKRHRRDHAGQVHGGNECRKQADRK